MISGASDPIGPSLDGVLPFADFLQSLRSAGVPVDTHDLLDLAKLLERWPGTDRDQFRDAIAALLARDRNDIRRIHDAFDAWFPRPKESEPTLLAKPPEPKSTPKPPVQPPRKWRIAPWPAAAFAIMLTVLIASLWPQPEPATPPKTMPVAQPVQIPETQRLEIDSSPPPPPPAAPSAVERRAITTFPWTVAVILTLGLLAGAAHRRARARGRKWMRKLAARELPAGEGPHRYEPAVAWPASPIPQHWIEEAANIIGRGVEESGATDQLDVDESLRRTLRAGMRPILVFEPPPRNEALVVLEDTSASMEPWATKVAFLLRMLAREGVAVEHYYFNSDPTFIARDRHGRPFPLERLADTRSERSLLVISTGIGLDAVLQQRRRLAATFRRWPRRSWLNPIANRRYWTRALGRAPMNVWPLTRDGLSSAAWELAAPEAAPSRRRTSPACNVSADDVERMKRLVALVPYPTLALVEQLRRRYCPDIPEEVILFFAGTGSAVRGGRLVLPPDEVQRLLHAQRVEAPRREQAVRGYLLEVLNASEPPKGTLAHERWQLDAALQRVQLAAAAGENPPAADVEKLEQLAQGPLHDEVQSATQVTNVPPDVRDRIAEGARRFAERVRQLAPRWAFPGLIAILAAALLAFTSYQVLEPLAPVRTEPRPLIEKAYDLEFIAASQPMAERLAEIRATRLNDDVPDRPMLSVGTVSEPAVQLPVTRPVTEANSGMYWQLRAQTASGSWAVSDALWVPKMRLRPEEVEPTATITIYVEIPDSRQLRLPYRITPAAQPDVTPSLGIAGVPMRLPPGRWTASIFANGFDPLQRDFTVVEGENPSFTLTLVPNRERQFGTLDLRLPPGALPSDVTVQSTTVRGPFTRWTGDEQLPAGRYTATFRHDFYDDRATPFAITAGGTTLLDFTARPAYGVVTITSDPAGAQMTTAGTRVMLTPGPSGGYKLRAPSGTYDVHAKLDGFLPLSESVQVAAGRRGTFVLEMKPALTEAGGHNLGIRVPAQELDNWSWAAVAAGVIRHYEPNTSVKQCEIASQALGKDCCSANGLPVCNVPYSIVNVLESRKLLATNIGPAAFSLVKKEIDEGRPIVAMIALPSGGGHFVVIAGYRQSAEQGYLGIQDPYTGDLSIVAYDLFLNNYKNFGRWVETYTTQSPR
ncbi:MAG TPA: C39 family peptidase [Thermoanaerobaculia bacterium]